MATNVNLRDATTKLKLLKKAPGEEPLLDINCAPFMPSGDTISSVTSVTFVVFGLVTEVLPLLIVSPVTNGTDKIQATYKQGTDGEKYLITAKFVTDRGDKLEAQVVLEVTEVTIS